MLKKIGRALIGVLLISLMIFLSLYLTSRKTTSTTKGHITFIVNNINNEIVLNERLEYEKGDTLFSLLDKKYDLIYSTSQYGHYITGIKTSEFNISTTGTSESWIWFEMAYLKENTEYSSTLNIDDYEKQTVNYGIDNLELVDNMIFAFNEQNNSNKTSIFNQEISKNNNNNYNKIFRIIAWSFIAISFIIVFIIMFINSKFKVINSIKEITLLASMTVLLFVQEEVLTFIPNFQFTFFLIILYSVVFKFGKTFYIILIHVLLDNLIMGSFNLFTICPMLIAYLIIPLVINVFKIKNNVILALLSIAFSLIYAISFIPFGVIMLDVDLKAYILADIPFDIVLIVTNFTLVLFLFNPIYKVLNDLNNNFSNLNPSETLDIDLNNEENMV